MSPEKYAQIMPYDCEKRDETLYNQQKEFALSQIRENNEQAEAAAVAMQFRKKYIRFNK